MNPAANLTRASLGLIALTAAMVVSPAHNVASKPANNACAWSLVTTPSPAGSHAAFEGVSERTPNDVWAVAETVTGNLIERWHRKAWKIVPGPRTGGQLYALKAIAKNDVWFAGSIGERPLIEHWNGSKVKVVLNPGRNDSARLTSMAAASASSVWAVGGLDESSPGLIEHWNGSGWTVTGRGVSGEGVFNGVSARSGRDVWVAGDYYVGSGTVYPQIDRWWAATLQDRRFRTQLTRTCPVRDLVRALGNR
jgi:hypothetical protein